MTRTAPDLTHAVATAGLLACAKCNGTGGERGVSTDPCQECSGTGSIVIADQVHAALLAIAAEDWNDETVPLLDEKPQGIGPCARARRLLGLTYEEAVIERVKSLAPEFRSKRAVEKLRALEEG